MSWHTFAHPLVIAAMLLQLPLVRAETTTLDSELERVVKILKGSVQSGQSVRVEPFSDLTAGSDLSGSIKTGLSEAFADECQRQSLRLDRKASYIVSGKFFVTDEAALRSGEPLVLELHWGLTKRTGQTVVEIMPTRVETRMKINDLSFVAQAVGLIGILSADVPADLPEAQKLTKLALKPTGVANSSLIKSAPASPYAVEIRSRQSNTNSKFEPLFASTENGRPFVDIPKGHEYQIWIYNHSREPVAVAPSIDGLSTFHFADSSYHDPASGKLTQKHFIIPPAQPGSDEPFVGVIRGWHFSNTGNNNVGRFLVGNYGDSAAASVGVPEGQDSGAIHLQFSRCQERNRGVKTRGIGDDPKGTVIGQSETVKFELSKLLPGEPIEFLTIRYDR